MFYIVYMNQMNINGIDLNLLKSLNALIETESVTKAAEVVNLSQPAMSHALGRLQHLLKDPVLIRSGRGMVLTPRGEALREPVQRALDQVSKVFEPQIFNPALAEARFSIMAPDYLGQIIMAPVIGQALTLAPNIEIELENISKKAIADMCAGKISLGFGVVNDGPELENVRAQALFEDQQICLMRKGHPLSQGKMSLKDYANARHGLLSITGKGGGRIDDVLKSFGFERKIALRVSHYLTISEVLSPTDLLMTVPQVLANKIMTDQLCQRSLPKELQLPSFTVSQIWHERFEKDPAHQWLRRLIKATCQANF